MTRCPHCRAILPERTASCPFCDGEPEADLLGLAEAAGAPDPERFAAAVVASAQAAARSAPAPFREGRRAAPTPFRRDGTASDPEYGARSPRSDFQAPENPAPAPELEIAEERVSRHDEPIGFQRSPMVQALIVVVLILFIAAALAWFWN